MSACLCDRKKEGKKVKMKGTHTGRERGRDKKRCQRNEAVDFVFVCNVTFSLLFFFHFVFPRLLWVIADFHARYLTGFDDY